MLNTERQERMQKNTRVLKSLVECILFCGRQGLALREHRDDYTASKVDHNRENFLELVAFRALNDNVLAEHLKDASKNAVYTIQNELKFIIGEIIRKSIIDEITNAKYYSILVDEVTDCANLSTLADEVTDCANLEQLSLVLQFV